MSELTITHAGNTVTQLRPGMKSNNAQLNNMNVKLFDVPLTTDAETHSDNDVITLAIEIPNAVAVKGGSAIIQSAFLINGSATPDEGEAIGVVDAEALKLCGSTTVSNWSLMKTSIAEVAVKSNIGLVVQAKSDSRSIFVFAINRSGADYTPSATDSLHLRLGIVQD